MFRITFFLLISIALGCATKDLDRTSIFKKYLNNELKIQIPEEKHLFIIIPKTGCQGGIEYTLIALEDKILPSANITVISNNVQSAFYLSAKWNIKKDTSGKLEYLNIGISNVTFITTEGGKIQSIYSTERCSIPLIDEIIEIIEK
jgi:hypothetical protein